MFLVQLDVTVVNVALPTIGRELGAGVGTLQGIVDGYAVVLAALLLAGGALGDVLGHRRIVATGFATFGLASAACALAPSGLALVAFRAVQGLGAALLLPGTLAVITNAYPGRRERARALGVWAGVSALALAAGPVLGGALVAAGGWRILFWLNVPLVALAILASLALIEDDHRAPRRVDFAGAASAAVTLAALVFAVIEGSGVSVAAAAVAAVVFVVVERRAPEPMLPGALLRSRQFAGANLVAGAMNFVGLGMILVLTLYLQGVLRYGPFDAAVRLLPGFVPLSLLAPVSGRLVGRFGPRPLMIAGLAVGAVALLNLLRVTTGTGYLTVLPSWLGLGIGMGLLTAAVVSAAVGGVPPDRAGLASGVNNTARQAFGALGVAVFGHYGTFAAGLHTAGILGAAVWGAAIGITACTVR
ncbi:MFS transporter [Amycolatopsis alkalitolerans]|uniref:MFS transporter n=2 Tax=Amycolatopsis alkalitolerans TaxID=2547244 RepID=A0A5C4LU28_9PSEU|nr:MFS transporter [Amycolatopsis alkalitolerans]